MVVGEGQGNGTIGGKTSVFLDLESQPRILSTLVFFGGEPIRFEVSQIWLQIPALLSTGCLVWAESLNPSIFMYKTENET